MQVAGNLTPQDDMEPLREGIKNRYKTYHLLDKDRFPLFEFNSNRANYQPLKDSFDEEFYVKRGIDRKKNTIHIPSTNTLVQIFCDNKYVPGQKILNTCRSYAEGPSPGVVNEVHPAPVQPASRRKNGKTLIVALALPLLIAAIYMAITRSRSAPLASGLIIHRPHHRQTVPRRPIIEGRVTDADTIWIVIRPTGWNRYYVQPPIRVRQDGTWSGDIYVGSFDKENIGLSFQLRAFVNPDASFKLMEDYEKHVFTAWPKAELSSGVVEVVRGEGERELMLEGAKPVEK